MYQHWSPLQSSNGALLVQGGGRTEVGVGVLPAPTVALLADALCDPSSCLSALPTRTHSIPLHDLHSHAQKIGFGVPSPHLQQILVSDLVKKIFASMSTA